MSLPAEIGVEAFDALHDDLPSWRGFVETLAREHGGRSIEQLPVGTVLVARVDGDRVLKLYPPFLRDHFEYELAMLEALQGRLSLPTPRLLATSERDGWPYLLISWLTGEPLTRSWPAMDEDRRRELLRTLGALAAEVHALPVGRCAAVSLPWNGFIDGQRRRCLDRQRRNGLPAHLLAQLEAFIAGELPLGRGVMLTGEYTPFNLLTQGDRLAAMYDFGDGLVGPREYDWLGPMCFLAAGDAARLAAFFEGYGCRLDPPLRLKLLRLLLLHRYSNPPRQIAHAGWMECPSFEATAETIWPLR